MEFVKNLQLLTSKYDSLKNSSFLKKTYQVKLSKYQEVFNVELESLLNNCLKVLNSLGQTWKVNVFVVQSYDKALGFSSTPVGEYRYENIYKIEFTNTNAGKTVYLPLLSCRLNAKSKFDYVNNPFPKDIKVNLLDLHYNEKKLEKLYVPLSQDTSCNKQLSSYLTDVMWVMIQNNTKDLLLNSLLPAEIDKLCSLYENNASKDEIEKCKNTIKMFHKELATNTCKER